MEGTPIIELINLFSDFQKQTGRVDLIGFSVWLNQKTATSSIDTKQEVDINRTLVWLVHRLAKIFKWYAKSTLNKYGLVSMDEYFILTSVEQLGNPSKTEVYSNTISDINAGTQMMKRLLDAGMIKESIDSQDRRVRRVQITAKGKKVKEGFFKESEADLKLKGGNLTYDEKLMLIKTLQRLEKFHTTIYFNESEIDFGELAKKYLLS